LSRIRHRELVEGIEDHLFDAQLFNMKVDWYGSIIKYLTKGYFDIDIQKRKEMKSHITIKARPYDTLYDSLFYRLGPNCVLHQCRSPLEVIKMLEESHEGSMPFTNGSY